MTLLTWMKIDFRAQEEGLCNQYQAIHEIHGPWSFSQGSVEMPFTIMEAESSQESEIRSSK